MKSYRNETKHVPQPDTLPYLFENDGILRRLKFKKTNTYTASYELHELFNAKRIKKKQQKIFI